jgi:uncharacterized protein
MKNGLFIVLVFLACSAGAQTGEKNFIDQNYIEVTGKAEMEIVPDQIFLNIQISEKDSNGKQSIEELEKKMSERLRKLNINTNRDLSVKDFSSNFKSYIIKRKEVLLTKEYQLIVHDAKTMGLVFQNLQELEISNISVLRVDHSDIQRFRREIKMNAMRAAKDKAGDLARAINQDIGKALYIQELENPYLTGSKLAVRVAGISNIIGKGYTGEDLSQQPDSEFEKIKLEYSILARFELK